MSEWYVFYTQFNHEKKVHEEALRLGFESYCPKLRVLKQWSDRKKWTEVPMFPCYNFVKCELEAAYSILKIKGVVKLVSFSGQRAFLRQREIELIQQIELNQESVTISTQKFKVGEMIKIESGCFKGLSGSVVENVEGEKLVMLIELLGQAVLTTFQSKSSNSL